MDYKLKSKLLRIKLLASDFDGVMTDGYVYIDQNGRESVRCSRKDGLGIELLKKAGLEVIVLSKEANQVVKARCDKLKIKCWQGIRNGTGKLNILENMLRMNKLDKNEVCYIGDDLNDIEIIKYVGIGVSVADGHPVAKKFADYITKSKGGYHAVRELAELILKAKGVTLKI